MKLHHVSIKNFRSIKDLEFSFPKSGILVLVGANNSGKSNIIRAINNMCGDQWFSSDKLEHHDHYLRKPNRTVQIKLSFDDCYCRWSSGDDWNKWPALYGFDDKKLGYPAPKPKDAFPCIYLAADRSYERQTSFYDWTLVGKIRHAFHHKAGPVQEELRQKFEDIVKVFNKVEGLADFKADFAAFFEEMQADTSTKLDIDFKPYTPSNYFKTMQIVAEDHGAGGEKVSLDELGEGTRNMVLLALLRSYAKNFREASDERGGLIALEEPELYMHPQARRHLARVLRELAESGMQVILSTHSGSFIDSEFFDSIGRVVKVEDDETPGRQHTELRLVSKEDLVDHCVKTGVPAGKTTTENIGEFYKATSNPMLNEAFFARFVILVEGDTEELAIPVFLAKAGFDCDLLGISIISVRGKAQIPKYWRLFSAFEIPLLVIADNDHDMKTKGNSNTIIATCFDVELSDLTGVDVCRLLHSNSEPSTPILMLDGDYEFALRKDMAASLDDGAGMLDGWEKDAKDLIQPVGTQNKGQVGRYVARRLCEETEFVPAFVNEILKAMSEAGFQPGGRPAAARKEQNSDAPNDSDPFELDYSDDDIPF